MKPINKHLKHQVDKEVWDQTLVEVEAKDIVTCLDQILGQVRNIVSVQVANTVMWEVDETR